MDYSQFNPRRTARVGAVVAGAASDFSTISLFNNATQGWMIAMRWFALIATAQATFNYGFLQVQNAGTSVVPTPLVLTDALPYGLCTTSTPAAQITNLQYSGDVLANTGWQYSNNIPLGFYPPGWSFIISSSTANITIGFSLMYEIFEPQHLDPERWIAANLALTGGNLQ
jgi:hypothetical protein